MAAEGDKGEAPCRVPRWREDTEGTEQEKRSGIWSLLPAFLTLCSPDLCLSSLFSLTYASPYCPVSFLILSHISLAGVARFTSVFSSFSHPHPQLYQAIFQLYSELPTLHYSAHSVPILMLCYFSPSFCHITIADAYFCSSCMAKQGSKNCAHVTVSPTLQMYDLTSLKRERQKGVTLKNSVISWNLEG